MESWNGKLEIGKLKVKRRKLKEWRLNVKGKMGKVKGLRWKAKAKGKAKAWRWNVKCKMVRLTWKVKGES